jgi:hypothetical protein
MSWVTAKTSVLGFVALENPATWFTYAGAVPRASDE